MSFPYHQSTTEKLQEMQKIEKSKDQYRSCINSPQKIVMFLSNKILQIEKEKDDLF